MRVALGNLAALALLASLPGAAFAEDEAKTSGAGRDVETLADEYYRYQLAQWGSLLETNGSVSAGTTLGSVTPAAYEKRTNFARKTLDRLESIDLATLDQKSRIDAAVLRTQLIEEIGNAEFREWEMPFDSDNNFWSYLAETRGLQSVEDYDRYIARMRDLPRYFSENVDNARSGLKRGFSVPRVTLEGRDASLEAYVVDTPEQSPFWGAFAAMPSRFSEEDRARLLAEGRSAIADDVTPAYRRLLAFMRQEYLPQTRATLAAEAMPDGPAYYAQQIRQYTTLDLTAAEIHQIGVDEVARITAEMESVKKQAGFDGTLAEFVHFLRTDPQFVARTPDELMGVSAYTAKRVDGELAKYFGLLPRHRFAIRPVDPSIAPFYTAGRGGLEYCQMNTYDLASRPLYNIPALTLHECAPGHSFQAAVALEQPSVAPFRRQTYFSGFGEGWGLYTEFLGEEMGIYRTPYERFGRLSYEMWRAVRLVIDTGIHHYGWDRERAFEYLAARTALSRHEVNTEVDRYISWPGQALAYKLGEMTIRRVRTKAETALGDRFDIRKFHDVVLSLGSVPLPALEDRIDAFIADGGKGIDGVNYD